MIMISILGFNSVSILSCYTWIDRKKCDFKEKINWISGIIPKELSYRQENTEMLLSKLMLSAKIICQFRVTVLKSI